jgi:hypothetical protein
MLSRVKELTLGCRLDRYGVMEMRRTIIGAIIEPSLRAAR